MLSAVLSNRNFAFSFGFRRGLIGKRGSTCRLFENLTPIRAHKSEICYTAESFRSKHSASVTLSLRPSSGRISESSMQTQVLGMKHRAMAASSTTVASGDLVVDSIISSCGSGLRSGTKSSVYFSNRTLSVCQNASLNSRDGDSRRSGLIGRCSTLGTVGKFSGWNPHVGSWLQSYVTPSSNNYSTGAVPDVSHGGSWPEEQIASLAISEDQKTLGDRKLRLLSGSFYLPHPDKEATGGEDAHFICEDEQAIGVADGVGGWADVGVNAGIYSSELMSNSVKAIRGLPKKLINPAQVLEKAHANTKSMGSSTACIIVLGDQGLHAINLGDSGFIVVRDGRTIFESPVQQHGFNFPYQLESGNSSDLPSSGQVFEVTVSAGDVIIAGTDGLFDNLYNHEINAIVANALAAKFTPEETAQKIAALARERAHDKHRQTPFSAAAQQAGLVFYGGKLDDVTVVVSYITSYNPSHKTSNIMSS